MRIMFVIITRITNLIEGNTKRFENLKKDLTLSQVLSFIKKI